MERFTERITEGGELTRITAFTDAVMAVAITLLVLNIEVPTLTDPTADEIWASLRDLLDDLAAYLLSFALVGRFWLLHHQLFERLRAFDRRLMLLNLAFLALIALVPFCASLLDHYGHLAPGSVVFAAVIGLAALTHASMVRHAEHAGLELRSHGKGPVRLVGVSGLFLASVPVAFLSTEVAQGMWLVTLFLRPGRRSPAES
jgi:TMEM175 potassium channel family protein